MMPTKQHEGRARVKFWLSCHPFMSKAAVPIYSIETWRIANIEYDMETSTLVQ
jgi:hypothetical protein